jgi:hypothetical protein
MSELRDLEILENRLLNAGRTFIYPRTPDLPGAFQRRSLPASPSWRRWAIGVAILLAAIAALFAVPEVRARLLEFLQIGAIRIEPPAIETPTQPPDENKDREYGTLIPISHLSGETTLEDARTEVDFPISVPTYPSDLGAPDHVYVQQVEPGASFVVITWMNVEDPEAVALAFYVIGPGVSITKGPVDQLQAEEVDGEPAAYIRGMHFLQVDRLPDYGVLVQAPALIWESKGITYRIEADLPVDVLIRIAESLNNNYRE